MWYPEFLCGLTVWSAARKHLLLVYRVRCASNGCQKQSQRAKTIKNGFFWIFFELTGLFSNVGRSTDLYGAPGAGNFFPRHVSAGDWRSSATRCARVGQRVYVGRPARCTSPRSAMRRPSTRGRPPTRGSHVAVSGSPARMRGCPDGHHVASPARGPWPRLGFAQHCSPKPALFFYYYSSFLLLLLPIL